MTDGNHVIVQIQNGLGGSAALLVNGAVVKPDETVAYQIPAATPVTIERRALSVSITVPNATPSEHSPREGICVCVSSNLAFTLIPAESLTMTIQTGYIPGQAIGVRCGDG